MEPFADPLWTLYVEPFIRALKPRRILEMSAGRGATTPALLAWCRESGCRADMVDPAKSPELRARVEGFAEEHVFHALGASKAIRLAEHPDLALLGDEPNWSTVNSALNLLRRMSVERGRDFPCVLVRHTGWPYGRRDMYARPELVEEKHPYAHQGVVPGHARLAEFGIGAHLAHAAHEGGPRNGVLTAVEDFISTTPFELHFRELPMFGGLGILVPAARMTTELQALIDGFFSATGLTAACRALEAERIREDAELARTRAWLERRTNALGRARELLAQRPAGGGASAAAAAPAAPVAAPPAAPQDETQQLRAMVQATPERPKYWRSLAASLAGAGDYEGAAGVWAESLAWGAGLERTDPAAGRGFLERIAARLYPFLVELIQTATAVDPPGLAGRWALVRRLYADPRFAELALAAADPFQAFVNQAGEDPKFKAANKHGADVSPLLYDALELFAPPAARETLMRACRAEIARPHGGLEAVEASARRLMHDESFRAPVVICGFHHSGTRLLARLLAEIGLFQRINTYQYEWSYPNQLNTAMEPGCMDPTRAGSGKPEPGAVSAERLAFRLAMAGLEPGVPWGFKDPRNALTARAWLDAFPGARVLHILRDPVATIATLPAEYERFVRLDERRPSAARFWSELWEQHVEAARQIMPLAAASAEIRFEDLCADPLATLGQVVERLGLGLPVSPDRLAEVRIEAGKTTMRERVRAEGRVSAPDREGLEALGERYGYGWAG